MITQKKADWEYVQTDTNFDGKITRDEWITRYGSSEGFDAYDMDGEDTHLEPHEW